MHIINIVLFLTFYIIFGNENFNILLTFNLQPNEKNYLVKLRL
jgi:hypothetical protein